MNNKSKQLIKQKKLPTNVLMLFWPIEIIIITFYKIATFKTYQKCDNLPQADIYMS